MKINNISPRKYHFQGWSYTPEDGYLIKENQKHRLPAKQNSLLLILLENTGQVVSKKKLTEQLWRDKVVNDEALARLIAELRSVLGDDASRSRFIETIPKTGYRFVSSGTEGVASDKPATQTFTSPFFLIGLTAAVLFLLYFLSLSVVNKQSASPPDWHENINQAKRITADFVIEYQPELSPDGNFVAYVLREDKHTQLRIQNIASNNLTDIQVKGADLRSPVWSPNGRYLAYAERNSETCMIKQYDVANKVSQELLNCNMPNISSILDWSSDGNKLAYVSNRTSELGSRQIWLYDFTQKTSRQITYLNESKHFDTRPRFSPDGKSLAFIRGTTSIQNIFLINLTHDSEPEQLTFNNSQKSSFAWIDSDSLIFDSNSRGDRHLWRFELTNKVTENLGAKDAQAPSIARNTKAIVFQEVRYQANLWLHDLQRDIEKTGDDKTNENNNHNNVHNYDQSNVTEIIASAKYDNHPAFAPDSNIIAYSSNRYGFAEIWEFNNATQVDRKLVGLENQHLHSPFWHNSGEKLLFTSISESRYTCLQLDKTQQNDIEPISELELGNCVYWRGKYLGIGKASLSSPLLYEISENGQTRQLLDESINKVMTNKFDDILLSKPDQDGIYKLQENGELTVIVQDFPWRFVDYWTLAGKYLYYLNKEHDNDIWRIHLDSLKAERVSDIVPFAVGSSIAVSDDGKYMITSQRGNNKGDLYLTSPATQ